MFAKRIALIVGLISLLTGLIAGGLFQAELAEPGLQVFPAPEQRGLFPVFTLVHRVAFTISLPLTTLWAPGSASFNPTIGQKLSFMLSALALIALLLSVILSPGLGLNGFESFTFLNQSALVIWGLGIGICGAALFRHKQKRGSVFVYLFFAFLFVAWGLITLLVMNNAKPDRILFDTKYEVSLAHCFGLAAIFIVLAAVSGMRTNLSRRLGIVAPLIGSGLIAGPASIMILYNQFLGLSGMPRGYMDYRDSPEFVSYNGVVSLTACLVSFAIVLNYLYWMRAAWEKPTVPPGPEESF